MAYQRKFKNKNSITKPAPITQEPKIAFGRLSDGKIMHVSEAQKGAACLCFCVECGSPLLAKKGDVNRWHFAHLTLSECTGESILHFVAKHLVVEMINAGEMKTLSPICAEGTFDDAFNNPYPVEYSEETLISPMISAEVEVSSGSQIVDVMAYTQGGERIAIEIFKTHKKNEHDCALFEKQALLAIEIDVSDIQWNITTEKLKKHLKSADNQKWLHHPAINSVYSNLKEKSRQILDEITRSTWFYVHFRLQAFLWDTVDLKVGFLEAFNYAQTIIPGKNISVKERVEFKIRSFKLGGAFWNDIACSLEVQAEIYSCKGKTVLVPCYFAPCTMREQFKDKQDGPYLFFGVNYNAKTDAFSIEAPEWFNLNAWQTALNIKADKLLRDEIEEYNQPYLTFRALSAQQKLSATISMFNVPPFEHCELGRFSKAWNTHDAIWRLHILRQVLNNSDGFIDTDSFYSLDMTELQGYLDFPAELQIERAKALFFWLKNVLTTNGCAEHLSRLAFDLNVQKTLGKPELISANSFIQEKHDIPTVDERPTENKKIVRSAFSGVLTSLAKFQF